MIAIIDYDAGNLRSVKKALLSLGGTFAIIRDRKTILKTDKVILPGVGSFGDAMGKLEQYGLVGVIHETVDQGTPFLGICLGLQLLFAGNEECRGAAGLGILPGEIFKVPEHPGLKIPHMDWNPLKIRPGVKLFRGIEDGSYAYFIHPYYLKVEDESIVAASTEYGTVIHASIERENVFACQFHPKKSREVGLAILKSFIGLQKSCVV